MSDLRDLYQDVILEHSKAPRNFRELASRQPQGRGLQSALRRSLHGLRRSLKATRSATSAFRAPAARFRRPRLR